MSDTINSKDIENLWNIDDVTTLPKENTYVIEDGDGKKYTLEYNDKYKQWFATQDNGFTYTLAMKDGKYSLEGVEEYSVKSFDAGAIKVKREGENTGYYKDPDPRLDYNLDELTRQAEINKKNGQTVTDYRVYTKNDPTQPQTLRITYDSNGKAQYTLIDHNGNSTSQTSESLSELGLTVSDTNNRYLGGDPYAGTYVDKDGNPINILKKKNADGTYADDTYEVYGSGNNGKEISGDEAKNLTSGMTRDDRSAIRNGPGSSDQSDIYDSEMHHHHVTKKITLSDITELNNQDISSYYGDKGTYNVGDRYTMGSDGKVTSSGSRLDFILDLAHTNQWSVKDAIAYVDGYDSDGDGKTDPGLVGQNRLTFLNNDGKTFDPIKGEHNYWNDTYSKWLSDLSDAGKAKSQADSLRSSVSDLKNNFDTVMDKLQGFAGEASGAAKDAIECILGKFAVTMSNIDNALEPACEAIMELVDTLLELQEENDLLQELIEKRNTLQDEMDTLKNDLATLESELAGIDETIEVKVGEDDEGNPQYETQTNPAYTAKKAEIAAKQAEIEAKQAEIDEVVEQIEEKMELLDELTLKVESYIQLFENLQTSVKTFSSIVDQVGSYNSAEEVIAHHDEILEKFESYELMPVITNLTDYKINDIIMFDDSYGTLYKIIGLDLESGRIKIVAVDENGNPIGEPIEIWDPREIAPTGPKPTTKDDPTPTPTPKPTTKPGPGPDPTDPPPGPTEPEPTVPPTKPPTHPTEPPTRPPTHPTEPPTRPPTHPTEPPTSPETYPYTEYVPYPVEDTEVPTIPLTGINSSASVKSSGLTGLGALAGLAAGAAGIGAAALSEKDEDDKDKDEENKKEHQSE